MKKIKSGKELLEIESKSRSIIFLKAEWSIYAVKAGKLIEKLENETGKYNYFYYTEIDEKDHFVALWLKNKNNCIITNYVTGAGSIVWLKDGGIKETIVNTKNLESKGLKEKFNEFIK